MTTQQQELHVFNGSDYQPSLDQNRLSGQYYRIFDLMQDQQWRTLAAIHLATGDPESSISAQLRHMRKTKFGCHTVNKRRVEGKKESCGLFEYQLIIRGKP
jgi:hypothetical protein